MRLNVRRSMEFDSGWEYQSESHTIVREEVTDKFELISAMHELGHAVHRHQAFRMSAPFPPAQLWECIKRECDAWEYAFACVKEPQFFLDFAKWCVLSHVLSICSQVIEYWHWADPLDLYAKASDALEKACQ